MMVGQKQVVKQIEQFEILNFSQSNQYFWISTGMCIDVQPM